MTSSNTHGVSVSYQYDSLNRLSAVVDANLPSGQNTTNYTYDAANNVATVAYPNGVESTFSYDTMNRVTGLSSQPATYNYQRDFAGNLSQATESSGRTASWTYDGIYRLTNETISLAPSGKNGGVSYGLDPVGNRTSATSTIPDFTPISGMFNQDDELASENYDQNGNVTAADGKTFSYNSQNQLTSMTASGTSAIVTYDGDGNRVAKIVNGVTTYYLVDDLNPTGYPQVVEELQGGAVTRQYTYGLQPIDENQPINNVWTPSFYGYDGGGNVRQLTNASGTVTDSYEYDAYGNFFAVSGTTPNNYLYRGEQYDSDLGLYYLRARYYNPLTGRFMSRDPNDPQLFGSDGTPTDPKALHKYLYADGDPINGIDPEGRADYIESIFSEPVVVSSRLEIAVEDTGYALAKAFCFIAKTLARASLGIPLGMSGIPGPPGWPGPAGALCGYFGPFL
jgi:RHS repeat-associated protein